MKENKSYVLHFLEETEEADQDTQVGLEDDAPLEARTTERDKTLQPEVLKETHPWEELEAAIKTEWVQIKGGVKADLGATVRRVARNEESNKPRKTWDEGDSQNVDRTSTSRQGEEWGQRTIFCKSRWERSLRAGRSTTT